MKNDLCSDLLTCILIGVWDANPQHLKFYLIHLKLLNVVYTSRRKQHVKHFFYYFLFKALEMNKSKHRAIIL